uniref:uncharacterized protein isoform X2 n=1 Tax=Myxine glutinosa TaxID=7769 RepID=UPI00358E98B8
MNHPWLLRLIIFITAPCFGTESSSPCPPNQFRHDDRICCEFCGIGTYMYKPCEVPGSNPLCMPCDEGTSYMDKQNNDTMCKKCSLCDPESENATRECDIDENRQCDCREDFHRKGSKCEPVFQTTASTSTSTESHPWWFFLLLLIGLFLILLFISPFVRQRFCPQRGVFSRFLNHGLPRRHSFLPVVGGSLTFSQVDGNYASVPFFGKKEVNASRRFSVKLCEQEEAERLMEVNTSIQKYGRTLSMDEFDSGPLHNPTLQDIYMSTLPGAGPPHQVHFRHEDENEDLQVQTWPRVLQAAYPRMTEVHFRCEDENEGLQVQTWTKVPQAASPRMTEDCVPLGTEGSVRESAIVCPKLPQPAVCIDAPLMDHMSVAEHHS